MKTLFLTGYRIFESQKKHNISVYATQASFFIVMAIFPTIILFLNLIQLLPIHEDDLIVTLNGLFPEAIAPLLSEIVADLYRKSSGTILSISALTALWSASKGVIGVEKGLNEVFEAEEHRKYLKLRIISALNTIAFIVMFIFALVILVFGNGIQITLANKFPVIAQISGYIISLRTLLSILILTLFFMLLYRFFPKRKTKWKYQLPGALFTTCGWMLFSFFFSIYVDNFGNFSYMYGSLTTMILLMLWLYVCIYIVFIGAEINLAYKNKQKTESIE